MHMAYCDVRLVLFYGVLLKGVLYSHAAVRYADPSHTAVLVGNLATDMEKLKSSYEKCMEELRQQAESIQRLQDLVETQAGTISHLQGTISQQQMKIEKIELTLQHATPANSFVEKPTSVTPGSAWGTSDISLHHAPGGDTILRSCDEIRSSRQSLQSGIYRIDPDGLGGDGPIQVFCNMPNGATLISHDTENVIDVKSCPTPGCFKRILNYQNATTKQLIALTRISATCQQQFFYDSCTEESLTRKRTYGPSATGTSWWKNRDGALRYQWPLKSVNQSEGNFITNRQDLPVTEVYFGPEYGVSGLCSSRFHIGQLICLGRSQDYASSSRGSHGGEHLTSHRAGSKEGPETGIRTRSRSRTPQTGVVSGDYVRQPSSGCVFDLHSSSPKYPPHLIDENNNIIQPVLQGKSRIISLNVDEKVTVGCLGVRHDKPFATNVLNATGLQINQASCTANSTLRFDQIELPYSQLGCVNQNKEILKEDGLCANGRGVQIRIGWNVGSDFIPLYDTCHDKATSTNYFSTHNIIGRSVDADDKSNTRPSFRQAGYYPGVDVNAAFGQAQQNKTIARVVGSETLAAKYLNQKKNFFLARGHLAPDGDFIDAGSQDATYYYLNMAPQWQSFNGGNWNILETTVRQIAITRDLDLTVYTGTFGIMTLTDAKGKQQPLYLTFDKNNNGLIPVPKYYWKLIHHPDSGTATAVLGINNPHLDRVVPADILCPDVCNRIPWMNWKLNDISKGYMFCCTAEELRKAIPFAPDLVAPLFL
ncbi:hypothetical protein GHT06_020089 [Daphnia sinensis]|uniref:DNA/RNA non-specific endonuclease/pyrophosphatase/phosphodiesterase domain-containing protein n=1 Tax=Daphnia sinensis TaxID=1820382 RepID=A0AAD5KM47_9CRUS|nr:hypothetical protein GHT06_006586 [Daphnia sinensis]KAI9554812.1 hypothetical protein GHT06_020089 [Daphnia sinensis]